ncbi:hypothetical protein GCM10023321_37530 [Pseudonocardia eucalypti]|uniref:Uncharacterized protein n=1 Tax=Pseudonocardia eucalypti TaxID=648755 RepID=A0ABP9Q7Y2_9PSEU|nr:hypothetical protein [Pseudonocardia eucalypti]
MTACSCGALLEAPLDARCWWPDQEDDPGAAVCTDLVRPGDHPLFRRWVRLDDSSMWEQRGSMVNYYTDITPPFPWEKIGECAWGTQHPVVYVRKPPGQPWVIG